jgi:hypothetical protein
LKEKEMKSHRYGHPGTGKAFISKEVDPSMAGKHDVER